jgi:hypothetical protein
VKYLLSLITITALLAGPQEVNASAQKQFQYLNRLFRSGAVGDWESSPSDPDSLHMVFRSNCLRLDSLLSVYTPYDTLSGEEGMRTILEIAECYSSLQIHDRAVEWWNLLRRIDRDGLFRKDEYGGLLQAGIRTGDLEMVRNLFNGVEFWDASVKDSLGCRLAESFRYLITENEDPDWLYGRYMMLKRFLPDVEVDMIYFSILAGQNRWDEAYALINSIIQSIPAERIDLERAHFMFSGYVRAAIMSGHIEEVESILERSAEYSFGDISSRLRILLPHVQMIRGRYADSELNYREICGKGSETACFWADLLERYREILNHGE